MQINKAINVKSEGFTITETVVSVALVVVFVASVIGAIAYISSSTASQERRVFAQHVASVNLLKYNNIESLPSSFSCSSHTTKSNALSIISSNSSTSAEPVPTKYNSGPFGLNQKVIAYSKAGCSSTSIRNPITIESTVIYKHSGQSREVTQVGYVL